MIVESKCKICSAEARRFASATILAKYVVSYFQCERCGFIQTEEPYWLEEAYSAAITESDIGIVDRNLRFARLTRVVIRALFNPEGRFLDYGGGYGLLVRMMRDAGYDFWWHDSHCRNVFAKGFDAESRRADNYELITAFEVFEHLVDPVSEIQRMLAFGASILFSTQLIPGKRIDLDRWWYAGLDHGQHVALYSYQALEGLAGRVGLRLYSDRRNIHLLTPKRLPSLILRAVGHRSSVWLLGGICRRRSLLAQDYYALTGKELG